MNDEKIIIKGDFSRINTVSTVCIIMGILSLVIAFIFGSRMEDSFVEVYIAPQSAEGIAVAFYLGIIFIALGIGFYVYMKSCELTVTDKRVYGRAALGKLVDLPLDKISAIATTFGKGIAVATSSGRILFYLINNQADVYREISSLLQDRQNKSTPVTINEKSDADELRKYKELLDSGVITQEEFEAKKKQLLGI